MFRRSSMSRSLSTFQWPSMFPRWLSRRCPLQEEEAVGGCGGDGGDDVREAEALEVEDHHGVVGVLEEDLEAGPEGEAVDRLDYHRRRVGLARAPCRDQREHGPRMWLLREVLGCTLGFRRSQEVESAGSGRKHLSLGRRQRRGRWHGSRPGVTLGKEGVMMERRVRGLGEEPLRRFAVKHAS